MVNGWLCSVLGFVEYSNTTQQCKVVEHATSQFTTTLVKVMGCGPEPHYDYDMFLLMGLKPRV